MFTLTILLILAVMVALFGCLMGLFRSSASSFPC